MDIQHAIQYFRTKFPYLGDEEQVLFYGLMNLKSFEANETIIKKGDYNNQIFYVMSGIIRGFYYHEEGHEMTMFFWEENKITASWESIYMNKPASINYVAVEPTTVVIINYEKFKQISMENTLLLKAYASMLEEILAESLFHSQTYMNEKPAQRYKRFITESKNIANRISQKLIASYVGITPISLSRMKKRIGDG